MGMLEFKARFEPMDLNSRFVTRKSEVTLINNYLSLVGYGKTARICARKSVDISIITRDIFFG